MFEFNVEYSPKNWITLQSKYFSLMKSDVIHFPKTHFHLNLSPKIISRKLLLGVITLCREFQPDYAVHELALQELGLLIHFYLLTITMEFNRCVTRFCLRKCKERVRKQKSHSTWITETGATRYIYPPGTTLVIKRQV